MKQTRLWILMGLLTVAAFASAVTPPVDLSLRGIVEWVSVGGHIASGTGALPAIGAKGSRYTSLATPGKPLDYRSNGTHWVPMGTWNHAALDNLIFANSGHGPVPMAFGGTGGIDAESARTSLDVFSKASTTAEIASSVDDLSGVTASTAARANIDVYSTTQVDEKIPNNASFSFDLLSDSPDYTGNGGKVLALNGGGTALEWVSVPGIGSLSHAGLSDLDFESSGHTGFTGATETASITSTLQAVMASVSAELDPANYQENYDIVASASALIAPLSGRTYVGIQNIDELKSVHICPNGLVASSGPANLVLYAGEVWYQRLTDSVPVAFYASEATPIVVFQGK